MIKHSLSLNALIYDQKRILQAVDAFKALASIHVYLKDEYFMCFFEKCKYDLSITKKEFENYVIDLMNVQHDN